MLKCSERCRETHEREPAHTGWRLEIQPQHFPRYFEIGSQQNFIYLLISAAMVSMMFRRLIWIHFFYHFLAIRLYHEFLSQFNCHFDIAFFEHYLHYNSSKTSQWNIMKFYLPTLKHLVIQLAKLQIYTLNLTTTFWHSKKNPITFEQECTTVNYAEYVGMYNPSLTRSAAN